MSLQTWLTSFTDTWKALTGAALLTAGLLKFTPLVPPWPDEGGAGASCLAVAACVIGIVLSYQCKRFNQKRRSLLGSTALVLGAILLVVYVALAGSRVATLVQSVQGMEVTRRVVVGTQLRNPADAGKTAGELLALYGLDAGAWTAESVAAARLALLRAYMGFYLALTFGIGVTQVRTRD